MSGVLHLVGVGPGDPELITLKAVRLLDEVPVVAFPAPLDGRTLALDIARSHLNPHAIMLPVALPMSSERAPARAAYDAGAAAIALHLDEGRDVAYLCEGDPMFYGSAMYLLERLGRNCPVRVIAGVTSLTAAAAAIPRPLGARNECFKVLPAPLPDELLFAELAAAPSAAIIKVGRHFERIRGVLERTGHAPGAVVVEHATTGRQRVTPLAGFVGGETPYFSIILCYKGQEGWGP